MCNWLPHGACAHPKRHQLSSPLVRKALHLVITPSSLPHLVGHCVGVIHPTHQRLHYQRSEVALTA